MKDYYKILEVDPSASQDEIKSQYRFLVQGFHPDKYSSAESKAKAEEKLKQINEAFSTLKDPAKRARYDSERHYYKNNFDYQERSEYAQKKQEHEEEKRRKEKAEREREKQAREEQFARAQAEKAQREADEKNKSQPIPIKKSAVKQTQVTLTKKPVLIALTVTLLGCFTIFIFGLGTRIFSTNTRAYPTVKGTSTEILHATITNISTFTPIPSEVEASLNSVSTPEIANQLYRIIEGRKMILIPAGSYIMGRIGGPQNEEPPHEIYLNDYYIDETEVTNAMYRECVSSGICPPPESKSSPSHPLYFDNPEFDSYPVIYVNWDMANTYCEWIGGRLPTEAEWEKAARGTDERIYPWGDVFDGNALNFCDVNCSNQWALSNYDDGYADTAPVGSFIQGKSPFGLLDMAGNVYEWVADWYSDSYYSVSPTENPMGPMFGDGRVLRGGAWGDGQGTSSTSRVYFSPSSAYEFTGFRCAQSP